MNHLYHLLDEYFTLKTSSNANDQQWTCATVVTKSGSGYRLPGAMMLISPWGRSYGLVSGGCLESDVIRRAQKVWQMNQADYTVYDTEDEDSFASRLGLGCNGKIGVLIQAVTNTHHELLHMLYLRMQEKKASYLLQCYHAGTSDKFGEGIGEDDGTYDNNLSSNINHWVLLDESGQAIFATKQSLKAEFISSKISNVIDLPEKQSVQNLNDCSWSVAKIMPPIHLWVLGGGIDAEPLVEIAATLGWIVTLVDHRVSYAREANFAKAKHVLNVKPEQAQSVGHFHSADAFICMTHNKRIDAQWMEALNQIKTPRYVGLLGPESRKDEVMKAANVSIPFSLAVNGPAGFSEIKGDLPESIALSILAQCHARLQIQPTNTNY